jgi:putative ABC transport system permease protein
MTARPAKDRLRGLVVDAFGAASERVPLALRNATSDRARLFRSAMGIGFAVLLMLMELGFHSAFLNGATVVIRALDGQLFVVSSQKFHFGGSYPFPRARILQAAGVSGIESVRPLYAAWQGALLKNPQTKQLNNVQVLAFDPDRPVFTLPEINDRLEALKLSGAIITDSRGRPFLGRFAVGTETELARTRVRVVGTAPFGPDFFVNGSVIMSDRNFLRIFADRHRPGGTLTEAEVGVVKLRPGADPLLIQKKMTRLLPDDVRVLTRTRFLAMQDHFESKVAPIGPIFGLGTVIGFAVGMLITYQILFADLSDQLPQYATLKAIGYGRLFLVATVAEQALIYGLAGYGPAWVVANILFRIIGGITLLPLHADPGLTIESLALTLGMCLVSGLIVVRRVIDLDPAEVF